MTVDPVGSSVAQAGPGWGAVSGGSVATASAGAHALASGGNAVDAVLAMTFAACVSEQEVGSLGGGGFLMVRTPDGQTYLRDFFVDTPGWGLPVSSLDLHFLPMDVTYPGTRQTFHVGLGSVAVPGLLAGLLSAHAEFARLELSTITAPARRYAVEGVPLEPAHGLMTELVGALMALSPEGRALVEREGRPIRAGDLLTNHDYGRFLEEVAAGNVTSLASEPFAGPLLALMAGGGLVTAADLERYQVYARIPATAERAGHVLFTNPPPSFGGSIIADTLSVAPPVRAGSDGWAALVATLQEATAHRRSGALTPLTGTGTTHSSAVDGDGMVAALTQSNGVASGFLVPGTGIQLNNMLGEADLNPDGFHATPPGQRMSSMMSPSILAAPSGAVVAMGTGGSERIRSSLVETMVRIIDLGQGLPEAVAGARVHPNEGGLQVEPHLEPWLLEQLDRGPAQALGPVNVWPEANPFFGGINAVHRAPDGSVTAVADGRRGGSATVVPPPDR